MKSKHTRYDWDVIQKDYDSGLSQPDLIKKYKLSKSGLYYATLRGQLKTRNVKESIELAKSQGKITGKAKTLEKENIRKNKLSVTMKKYGGYRQGSGRGKKGWYKGFFCDSSWELAYVIYCLDNNIPIERNTKKLMYVFDGKEKTYIPDFLVNNRLTEIKGYNSPQWKAKLKYNPDVVVLYENDMIPIIEYVTLAYGKDYIKLYEEARTYGRVEHS